MLYMTKHRPKQKKKKKTTCIKNLCRSVKNNKKFHKVIYLYYLKHQKSIITKSKPNKGHKKGLYLIRRYS